MSSTLVIGIGNCDCGDDAAGPVVVQRLRSVLGESVRITEAATAGPELMDLWQGAEALILIDAIVSETHPGTIHRLDAASPLPAIFPLRSSHVFSLAETIEIARALSRLPEPTIIYGIEGKHFDYNQPLSPQVEQSISRAVQAIRNEVEEMKAKRQNG